MPQQAQAWKQEATQNAEERAVDWRKEVESMSKDTSKAMAYNAIRNFPFNLAEAKTPWPEEEIQRLKHNTEAK